MFDFLFKSWRSTDSDAEGKNPLSLLPSFTRSKRNVPAPVKLHTGLISAPVYQYSTFHDPADYEVHWENLHSLSRAGPSSIAWSTTREQLATRLPTVPPPALTRLHPLGRSLSLPSLALTGSEPTSSTPKRNIRLHLQLGSTQSLAQPRSYSTDLFRDAYAYYPSVKPLSPIAEQDYFSPVSIQRSLSDSLPSPVEQPPASAVSEFTTSETFHKTPSSPLTFFFVSCVNCPFTSLYITSRQT